MATYFYEDNGGGIHAITGTNVLTGFERDAWDIADLFLAARFDFPDADEYDPDNFSGLSMEEAARDIIEHDDLIAEVSEDAITLYVRNMGMAGKALFQIKE